ncbi:hypothetical protein CPB83DRAFT_851896, partial [Crepidotus variabilis]
MDVLRNPHSIIYTDTNAYVMRTMYSVIAGLSVILFVASIVGIFLIHDITVNYIGVPYKVRIVGPIVIGGVGLNFIAFIWILVVALQGSPIMIDERCGAIVVGLSPRLAYLDVKHKDLGFYFEIVRVVLGLC